MRVAATVFFALLLLAAPAAADEPAGEASWEDQLREFGYLIVHLSTINVVNGLNLSRDQVVQLRELALRVERAGAVPPRVKGSFQDGWAGARKTYLDLREVLLQGKEVDEALRARVLKARADESRLLKETLTPPRAGVARGSCMRCHDVPGGKAFRGIPPASAKAEMSSAHSTGLYGRKALVQVWLLSQRVNAILTESQREIFTDFSCCLVPPAALSDPVRVGQAAVPDQTLDLLTRVRAIPERGWPFWRERILDTLDTLQDIRRPDVTKQEKSIARRRVAKVLEEARGLDDVAFELSKEELAKKIAGDRPRDDSAFRRAYFLLAPGSVKIYDAVLNRKPVTVPTGDGPAAEKPT
jgi:hypothetical protein